MIKGSPARSDLRLIVDIIPSACRVLDLGCGNGDLLALLGERKQVKGRGIELTEVGVRQCVARGLSVRQGNIDEGLGDYPTGSFDYVILSQTLPYIDDPRRVLSEMLRVGRQAVVTFPNVGHWYCRLHLLFEGRLLEGALNPAGWYESPRARPVSIAGFKSLCAAENIDVIQEIDLNSSGQLRGAMGRSLFATLGVFVLKERPKA
jgi:methionine biosynthesis protein MetW